MTTSHNFFRKVETSSTKRVDKPIVETRNAYDVSMHLWCINSHGKNSKKIQCKKKQLLVAFES